MISLPASSTFAVVSPTTVSSPMTSPRKTSYYSCRISLLISAVFGVTFAMTFAHLTWSMLHVSQHTYSITATENHYHHYSLSSNDSPDYFHPSLLPPQSNHSTAPKSLTTTTISNSTDFNLKKMLSLPSKWFISTERQSQIDKHKIADKQVEADPRPFVAIVMCIRSKPEWIHINQTTLFTLLLPSIQKTVTKQEWKTFRIEILIGFDTGDKFWEDSRHRELLQQTVAAILPRLGINFLALTKQRPHQIPFNSACRAAYELGSDYIVRINDDTEFLTPQWITKGIRQLNRFRPSKLGVVGPKCDQGKTVILTHDMVHRLHLDIFGMEYYPDEFDNWWIDDWITHVYGVNNTKRIDSWEVHHHIEKHGTRYHVDERLKRHLLTTVRRGRQTIRRYVQKRRDKTDGSLGIPKSQMKFQVLGTNRIPAAWGPSVDPYYKH